MISATRHEPDRDLLWDYDRGMLRSAFVSLFWAANSDRRAQTKSFTLQSIADALHVDKSAVSRWFGGQPNWTVNTIADLAHVLDLEIEITAKNRKTGTIYAPHGVVAATRPEVPPMRIIESDTGASGKRPPRRRVERR